MPYAPRCRRKDSGFVVIIITRTLPRLFLGIIHFQLSRPPDIGNSNGLLDDNFKSELEYEVEILFIEPGYFHVHNS